MWKIRVVDALTPQLPAVCSPAEIGYHISVHLSAVFDLALHIQLGVTSSGHLTAQDAAHRGPAIPQQTMLLGEVGLTAVVGSVRQGREESACSSKGRRVGECFSFSLID